jgi:hypothetical protein
MAEIKKINTDLQLEGRLLDGNGSAGTSGQVLSSTGTATDWVSLSEISGVDGSGNENYVAKWFDGDSITNSIIYDNGTNVGIGTPSPTAKLTVDGTVYLNQTSDYFGTTTKVQISAGSAFNNVAIRSNKLYLYTYTNAGNAELIFGDGNANWLFSASDARFSLYNYSTSSTSIYVSNTDNVGIGTTSPSYRLHIGGGIIGSDATSASNNTPRRIDLLNANTTGMNAYTKYYSNTNVSADFLGQYGYKFEGGTATANKQFQVYVSDAANPRLVVNGSGNVGIGTSSPSRLLDVDGVQGWSAGNVEKAYMNPTSTGTDFNLFGNNGNIRFDSRPGSNSYINTGNVGIGTTSPDEKLHITDISGANIILNTNTGANNSGVYMSEGSDSTPTQNGAYVYYDAAGNAFKIATGTTSLSDRLTIARDTGNVGIGTTSPDSKLHVVADNSTIATFESIGANANSKTFIVQSGGDRVIFDIKEAVGGTAADLAFELGNSEVMRLADTGNVGIGTTSPDAKLEIEGTGELSLKINNTQYSRSLIIEQGGGYSHLKTSHISGVAINYGQGNAGILSLFNNTTQAVRINANSDSYFNGGNVGIGTTSPGSELEVDGEITTTTITYPEPGALDSSAYNGEIVYFGTQISMTEGKLMVLSSSAGGLTWYLAKDSTTSLATGMLGIALGTTASAGVLVRGIAKNSAWSSFSEGDKLYLSPTGGSISNSITTDTNDFVRIVGYALGGSKIYFCPDNTYIQNA